MKSVEAEQPLSVLRRCQVLASIDEAALGELAAYCSIGVAHRGEALWIRGKDVEYFAAIESGFVKMARATSQGVDVTTEIFGPNQVFGMLGAIRGTGCVQSAYAVCETRFVKIPKDRFMLAYRENLIMKDQLLIRTSERLTRAHAMLTRMTTSRVEVRIAQVLQMLAESYGEDVPTGIELCVPLTRQAIAEMVGTTVETVIRVMSEWQKRQVVETHSKRILIRDPKSLYALLD